jgi:ABC-2 type transport system permease protein
VRKTLLIAWREFRQRVTSRGFLLGAIGTPLIVLVIGLFTGGFGAGAVAEPPLQQVAKASQQSGTIGYVDQADLIKEIPAPVPAGVFRPYPDVEAARPALAQGEIAAYYVVPADYRETGDVERVSRHLPTAPPDADAFDWVLVRNLYPDTAPERVKRLRWPFDQTGPTFVRIGGGAAGNTTLPFVVTIAIMLPLFTGGSYLFQSLTKEKSSRVIEILLVSVRPRQLLTGKLLGLGALILVQYAVWAIIASLGLTILGQGAGQLLTGIRLSAGEVLLALLYALGGFGLYAALMAGIGAMAPDAESSRGWIFFLTLPMMVPIYLWTVIVNAPQGALAIALSLFPYSAPIAMLMRMTATSVPAWQFAVSLGLLLVAVVGTIWLMARLFRAQTLLSGEPLSIRRFWSALTG